MPPPSLPELLALVDVFVRSNFPGRTPRRLIIQCYENDSDIAVPLVAAYPAPAPPATAEALDERGGRGLSPCVLDILTVLRDAGKRMSRTRILVEMSRRGMNWSERTVDGYLSRLVQDGTLILGPEGKGYELLPEEPAKGG